MKILVITGIFPPDIGGPASYVPKISEEIAKHGHIVTTITLSDVPSYTDSYNFDVVRIPRKSFKPIRFLKTILAIVRYGKQADLLFVNGLALEATIANYLLKRPVVHKVVGDFAWERASNKDWMNDNLEEFQRKRYSFKIEALKKLRNFWVRKSNLIIVPSLYMRTILKGWGIDERKIDVINNSLDELSYDKTMEFPQFNGFTVITIGRLIPLKRIDNLIRAIAELPDCRLIIVGDGPEEQNLKNIARELGINSRVIFTGQVSRKKALSYLKSADLFVQTSIHETFPHVILEAMQIGVPVIATKVGGIAEIVEDSVTGLLVEPNNNDKLKEAIDLLIKDEELRKKFVSNANEQIKKFSIEKMVENTLQVFSEATSEFYATSTKPSVLFVSGTRYSYPLNDMHKKKFSSLSSVSINYIFAFSVDNKFRAFFDSANFYLIPSKLPRIIRYPLFIISAFFITLYMTYKRKIKVIICQSPYEGIPVVIARSLLRILDKQISIITELHGDAEQALSLYLRPKSKLLFRSYGLIGQTISKFILKNSDVIRPVSEFLASKISQKVSKPIITFPAYTDIELFLEDNNPAKEFLIYPWDGFIFYPGVLIYLKGVHVLIKSIELVVKQYKGLKLLIAGEGGYKEELQKLVRYYRLEDNVIFLGHLKQSTLKEYMKRCAMLVLPSLSEGLGRVIAEAMACGKPVIGANVGGIPDLIKDGENGFLVPPNDVEALAEKITYLIENPEVAREMGDRGKKFILNRFSTESYVYNFRKMIQIAMGNI